MLTRKDYLQLFACLVLWAGNVIAIKMAVSEVDPMVAATLRFICAALLFMPFIKWPDKRTLKIIFQISMLMNVLHIGTLFIALDMLDAASVSILLQTQVVFATLLGVFLFKERIHWRTWTGMGIASFGIIVMLGEPDMMSHPQGVAIMLFSCLCLTLSYVRMKHLQTVHPATYVCLINLFAAPIAFAASQVIAPQSWGNLGAVDWHVFGPLLAYQAILVSSTHIAWQRLMHRGDVGRITAFTLLIPFLTIILSVTILGEHISWAMIAGGLITMLGVGIITLRRIQKGIA